MSITAESMTPADIRACTSNNDGGMWGGDWLAYLLLFALIGGGGFGNNCGSPCATQADLSAAFASNATLNGINGIDSTLCQGFNGINTAILQNGYNTQAGINTLSHQLADCCCTTQRAIDSVKYDMATQSCAVQNTIQNTTRDIIENANANSRAVLDFLVQSKLADKDARIATLEGQVARAEQNAFITANQEAQTATLLRRLGAECPQPAYVVQPPQPVTFPTNCCGTVNYASNGCGGCGSF